MRIHIATDHAGLDLSHFLIRELTKQGHDVFDHGPTTYDPLDDYPSFCINAALAVVADQQAGVEALGIVLGGSGNGEQIAANKVKGIRAALAVTPALVKTAREEQNANALVIGASHTNLDAAKAAISAAFENSYIGAVDSSRRIINVAEYENRGTIEGWLIEG